MPNNEKNSEEKFIQMLVKLFYKLDQNKFRKDIGQTKNRLTHSKKRIQILKRIVKPVNKYFMIFFQN